MSWVCAAFKDPFSTLFAFPLTFNDRYNWGAGSKFSYYCVYREPVKNNFTG